jgi:putative oxidoreductase
MALMSSFHGSALRTHNDVDFGLRSALRISVALVFAVTGLDKLGHDPHWIQVFATIGFGQWFRYATGVIELVGGLLFLVPLTTSAGAALLIAAMSGAMTVQITVLKHPVDSLYPGIYLAWVLLAYAKLRRARVRPPPPAQAPVQVGPKVGPTGEGQG